MKNFAYLLKYPTISTYNLRKKSGYGFLVLTFNTLAFVILSFLCLFLLCLCSCSLFSNNTAILWTDKPDIAAYVELFNANQDEFQIELWYHENPALSLTQSETQSESSPDIVVGEGLASSKVIQKMAPLDDLFEEEVVNPSIFYQELLEHGVVEGTHHLLPVSFNIPIIIYRRLDGSQRESAFSLSLDQLRELSEKYNQQEKSQHAVLGFSPRWRAETIYLFAGLNKVNFRESDVGYIKWNEENLNKAITYAQKWVDEVNGGNVKEKAFTDKYLYEPGYELVKNGRVRFYHTTMREFFIIPSNIRNDLVFSWLSQDSKIPTCDNIIYMGVLKESRNRRPVEAFIHWFFDRETQRQLLDTVQYKRIRTFGIAQGFSSIPSVNELIFPGYYPVLAGHIPPPESLEFSKIKPPDWQQAKKEAVLPWLEEAVNGTESTLSDNIRKWMRTAR